MFRKTIQKLLACAAFITTLPQAVITPVKAEVKPVDMYRLYNPNSGEHFYTAEVNEKDTLVSYGWKYEGIGWTAPSEGDEVYRLYNANAGDHHYTLDVNEKNTLVSLGWKYEGVGWYSDPAKYIPLYRQYNPNAKSGSHNYTTSKEENDALVKLGWKAEGIGWYGVGAGSTVPEEKAEEDERKAQYTYELYQLSPYPVYEGVQVPVYVKTDNPDPKTIAIHSDSLALGFEDTSWPTYYEDCEYFDIDKEIYGRVEGGYVFGVTAYDTSASGEFEVREYYEKNEDGEINYDKYAIVKGFHIEVLDYTEAVEQWRKDIIDESIKNTGKSKDELTSLEILSAVVDTLTDQFVYLTNDGNNHHRTLARIPNSPYFLSHRWDSYASPAVLCQFAEEIGGFEEIHNMYGDYSFQSDEWSQWHYYMYVVYEGEKHYFEACPYAESGAVPEIDMIDFSDLSEFKKW